jgi:DNA invertase Pin-like site-specific DNA recombinase
MGLAVYRNVEQGMSGMVIGYARTSTADQDAGLEAQERDLKAAGCRKVFAEQVSSVGPRPKLSAALDYLREGDTLVVTRPDRLARSTANLLAIVEEVEAKGAHLRILSFGSETLDTGSPTSRLMLTILGAVAEFERGLMLERQREGIAKAKEEGKYRGRVPTARRQAGEIARMHREGKRADEIADALGIGRSSVFRVLKEVRSAA